MTGTEWVRLAIAVAIAFLGSSVVSTLIQYRFLNPKTKAEASKLAAETRSIAIDDQSDIITNLRAELGRLATRVDDQDAKIAHQGTVIAEQGEQIAALQRKNRDLAATMRSALRDLLTWIQRALLVMSPDQRANVGQPPDYQHLISTERA